MKGGCHCGAIRYELLAEPFDADFCHCRDCQRTTGAPVGAWMDSKVDQVLWTEGHSADYASSAMVRWAIWVLPLLGWVFTSAAYAMSATGTLPRADVSVTVAVTPSAFAPLGRGMIELTMHNAGPDASGTSYPGSRGNLIAQRAFLLEHAEDPPPYVVLPGTTGCAVGADVVGPNVNHLWGFIWSFYFPPIPAGESITCRIPIQFGPDAFASFDTSWRISTNPEDPNLSNNVVEYRFVAGTPLLPPAPVPGLSLVAQFLLLAALATATTNWVQGRLRRLSHRDSR